ncbi:MarR family transcriptional regulator [Streptomyces griseoaurantiacus]|uniref:MarR family winged helix-turn-helix transcriptional regulator n=1 Tax=Streptomyces griseoaurantiacus TaxID=68213 RepID=UPI00324BE6D7
MTQTGDLGPEEWELWGAWTHAQRLLAQEIDTALQRDSGISKAEFSVLMTLSRADVGELRVGEIAASLRWDKSRVSHQLTRMEKRGFVTRSESGAHGRRTGITLTEEGRGAVREALTGHAGTLRRHFFAPLTPEQAAAIRAWSEGTIARLEGPGDTSA